MENRIMLNKKVLDEIGSKVSEIVAQSPAKDIEKNLRVLLMGVFNRMDLVTRDEFDVQQEVLQRTREKLIILEAKVATLESQLEPATPESNATEQPTMQPKDE
jgi:ubiquinone biosynthesis accessory factor UbiK